MAAYAEIEEEGTRLVLRHYAFRTWNGMHKKALNLHGHSHGKLAPMPRQFDVGVDAWDMRPVTLGGDPGQPPGPEAEQEKGRRRRRPFRSMNNLEPVGHRPPRPWGPGKRLA